MALIGQETSQWCWAASGEMVMEYHGASVAQCDEANKRFGRSDCCNSPVPGMCVMTGWPEFPKYGFTFANTSDAPLTWEEVKNQIYCKERPFCVTWHWTGGGGHMMTCPAYCEVDGIRYVTINDPLPVNQGSTRILTYQRYVSGPGYTHWNDYYDIDN
jgi:hypothetical protein